jgi:uncharacterized protein (TIRG00374 family)
VAALVALNIGIVLMFSGRWWMILSAQGYRIPYLSLAGYRLVAFGISYFTLGTQFGGEPYQIHSIHKHHNIPAAVSLASVTLDKLLELLINFAFLVIGVGVILIAGFFGKAATTQVLLLATGLLALPAGYLLILQTGSFPMTWVARHVLVRWSTLKEISQLIAGAEQQVVYFCRRQPIALLRAIALSMLVWAAMVLEFWLMLHFLGLQFELSQVIGALTAARLAFLLPVPAGLGALEASQVIAMQAFGVHPALGISISLLIRARDITFGVIGLWWAGVLARPGAVNTLPSQAGD